ncbi:hypothetical protein [Ruminococcus champanellensis]
MHKYLSDYMKQMNRLLEENRSFTETDLQRHLDKIGFMQHERLIHFLVTMLFAIVLFLVLGAFLMTEAMFLLPLLGLILVLLVPYIFHYYFLENTVQKMYVIYDRMAERMDTSAHQS